MVLTCEIVLDGCLQVRTLSKILWRCMRSYSSYCYNALPNFNAQTTILCLPLPAVNGCRRPSCGKVG